MGQKEATLKQFARNKTTHHVCSGQEKLIPCIEVLSYVHSVNKQLKSTV